mgnify:CR=1 FL=1
MGSSRPEEVAFFLENIIHHVPLPRNLIRRNKKNQGRRFGNIDDWRSRRRRQCSTRASVFLYTAGKCNPNPKNRQWCDLGKNHFDSVFLWIEWFHPWGRFGFMRMTGMILWRFIQNLFEMEYTYKKAMDSILGQREMVLFERIIICRWYNASTCSSYGGNVVSYTLGIWLLTTLV